MHIQNTSKFICAALLGLLLTACGGGSSSPSPLDNYNKSSSNSTSSGGTNSSATTTSGASSSASSVDTTTPAKLGFGSNTTYQDGAIGVGIGSTNLPAGGSTSLTVNVVSETNTLVTNSIDITFNSVCVAAGEASFTDVSGSAVSKVTTSNGQASIKYTANGCSGDDLITATAAIGSAVKTAQVTLSVAPDTVQTVTFVDASPTTISIKGTGGTETSLVRFKVTGSAGAPVKGETVAMTLQTFEGGLCLADPANNSNCADSVSGTSDIDGIVSVTVQAGTKPTPVTVTATATSTNRSTVSQDLYVSTGIPDQDSMSLASSVHNPSGWNHDGETADLTIFMADAFNNPPPDGTAVTFTAEGGAINSGCTTINGKCSVQWRSQNPRPTDGRVTIRATANGNESFVDDNGNGVYDPGVDIFSTTGDCSVNSPIPSSTTTNTSITCDDLPEAYLDKNENGIREAGEEYVDYNQNGSYTAANGIYNGVLCATEGANCTKTGVTVRAEAVLVMSSDFPESAGGLLPGQPASISLAPAASTTFTVTLRDINGNSMPYGTKIAINAASASDVSITQNMPDSGVTDSTEGITFNVTVKASDTKPASGSFDIQVIAPFATSTFTTIFN